MVTSGFGKGNLAEGEIWVSFLAEIWEFLRVRKKFWMLPILLTLAIFGAILMLAQGTAVAPFIYTLF
jgi:hypothetical protein